jgi:hypothetical protein
MRYPALFIEEILTVERKMAFIAGPRQVGLAPIRWTVGLSGSGIQRI